LSKGAIAMQVYIHDTKQTHNLTKKEALDLLRKTSERHIKFLAKIVGYSNHFVLMDDKGKEIKATPEITIDWKID
jgi:hypothetical protein